MSQLPHDLLEQAVEPPSANGRLLPSCNAQSHNAFRGLLYCMEFLEESLEDWLGEELQVHRVQDDFNTFFAHQP